MGPTDGSTWHIPMLEFGDTDCNVLEDACLVPAETYADDHMEQARRGWSRGLFIRPALSLLIASLVLGSVGLCGKATWMDSTSRIFDTVWAQVLEVGARVCFPSCRLPNHLAVAHGGCPLLSWDECCGHFEGRQGWFNTSCIRVRDVTAPSRDIGIACQPELWVRDPRGTWKGTIVGCAQDMTHAPTMTYISTTRLQSTSWGKTADGQPCRTVVKGERCYQAVWWALHIGISQHPDWYQGLTAGSSFSDMQAFLFRNQRNGTHCPLPCSLVTATTRTSAPASTTRLPSTSWGKTAAGQPCRAVTKGEPCFQSVEWAMHTGLKMHPTWYEGLTSTSGFEAFQALLARSRPGGSRCPLPCKFVAPSTPGPSTQAPTTMLMSTETSSTPTPATLPQVATSTSTSSAAMMMTSLPGTTATSAHSTSTATKITWNTSTATETTMTTTLTSTTTTTTPPLTTAASKGLLDDLNLTAFYAYRAQSDATYPLENVNAADLGGVLWYLQNEVLTMCPRKFDITRILRFKVTARWPYLPYVAFDSARCTVQDCPTFLREGQYRLGCQTIGIYDTHPAHWLSLPGPCPSQDLTHKTQLCKLREPGGACHTLAQLMVPESASNCTYYAEPVGELRLEEITGITNYSEFCEKGGMEYNTTTGAGRHMDFWDGLDDHANNTRRMKALEAAFKDHYPYLPATLGRMRCAPGAPAG